VEESIGMPDFYDGEMSSFYIQSRWFGPPGGVSAHHPDRQDQAARVCRESVRTDVGYVKESKGLKIATEPLQMTP
jgi:hypothetical protein